ncbi:MAG: hypothetical protein NVS1B6_08650 [Steroidobacteraceae bacterium]
MARTYAATAASVTNTASSTLPSITLIGTSSIKPRLFRYKISSPATVADNSVAYQIQRCTTTGTVGSSVTPQALDPGDPAAGCTVGLAIFSVGPTLTAGAIVDSISINLRAWYEFQAAPTKEIVIPASASNGLAWMPISLSGAAYANAFALYWEE